MGKIIVPFYHENAQIDYMSQTTFIDSLANISTVS